MSESVAKMNFECPVCGCNKYEEIKQVARGMGSPLIGGPPLPMITVGYECTQCSVTFSDPEKFSKKG